MANAGGVIGNITFFVQANNQVTDGVLNNAWEAANLDIAENILDATKNLVRLTADNLIDEMFQDNNGSMSGQVQLYKYGITC